MKLYVLSDLHNEFSQFTPPELDADLVVLAGDIDTKIRGVKWANETFHSEVIYVCGNHEFYGGHIDHTLMKIHGAAASNVHVLENTVWTCGQVRFLGTTGWTDYSSTGDPATAARACRDGMNDFRMIRADANFRRLRPDDLIRRNHFARDWLANELRKPYEGKTVVVTHHAPVVSLVGEGHDGHLSAAYANAWEDLVGLADLWIFGHTHEAVDTTIGGCKVISNPRGYPSETNGFIPGLQVEI